MSTILTSIHGKQLGLDKDGYLTCPVGLKVPAVYVGAAGSEVLQSGSGEVTSASTAANIAATGLTWFSSAIGDFTLDAPTRAGQVKTLFMDVAPATTTWKVTTTAVGTSTKTVFRTTGAGPIALTLQAISTALWAIRGGVGSPVVSTA